MQKKQERQKKIRTLYNPQSHKEKCMHYISVPFCGGELPDLTSDEFNCKHLRVVDITDEGKYLKGDEIEDKSEKKRGRGEFTHITSALILAVNSQ